MLESKEPLQSLIRMLFFFGLILAFLVGLMTAKVATSYVQDDGGVECLP